MQGVIVCKVVFVDDRNEKMPAQDGLLKILPLVLGFASLIIGTVFPALIYAILGFALVNVIWGVVYGLGFSIWQFLLGDPGFGNLGFIYAIFGAVIWPIAVFLCVTQAVQWISTHKPYIKTLCYFLFLLSFIIVLPPGEMYIPTFAEYFR